MEIDIDKIKDVAGEFAAKASNKAVEVGAEVADQAMKGFQTAQEAVQAASREMRLKHYSPLFPDAVRSDGYTLPQMIVIVDGDERKDVDVCEGAIGWSSDEAQLNIVHLYSRFAETVGVMFYPSLTMDSVYLAHPHDPDRYIDLSCYFKTIEDEQVAELIEVGRCLGAKKCRVETFEVEKHVSLRKGKAKLGWGPVEADMSDSAVQTQGRECTTLSVQEFSGSDTPQRPVLRMFKNNVTIVNLIESFCGENNANRPKHMHREIDQSSTSAMSCAMAGKVETALKKLGAEFNFSFEGEVKKESRQTLALDIEF